MSLRSANVAQLGEVEHRVEPARAPRAGSRPIITPLSTTFSREVSSGLKPTPSSMNGASRPAIRIAPGVGAVDARHDLQQRALARAVAADDPEELALVDVEGDAAQRAQLARGRRARADAARAP